MRSAVIFAALAVGTCARVIEKEVYVTEWTTTTVTETVTQWPTNAPSTAVSVKQDHTKPTIAALPTVDVSKKVPVEVKAAPAAAPTTAAAVAVVEPAKPSSATTSSTTSSSTTEAELKAVTISVASTATTFATFAATSTTAAATVLATVPSAAPAAPAVAPAVAAPAAAPAAGANSYQDSILHYHNIHRSEHSSSPLSWSEDLAGAAHTLASRCTYAHDTSIKAASGDYGQNIAYGYEAALVGEKVIGEMMYTDEAPYFANLYGQANPDMTNFEKWGHFTQIVWKATSEVGCATVDCSDLGNVGGPAPFTVCNYGTPGNYEGEYAANVLRPSS